MVGSRYSARSRRQVLRAGATAAVLVGGAAWGEVGSAAPRKNDPIIDMVVSVANQGAGSSQDVWLQLVQDYIDRNWLPSRPGVRVTVVAGSDSDGPSQSEAQVIAASLAGQGPTTVTGCCTAMPQYTGADLLLPLASFIKADNVDLGQFAPWHLQFLQSGGRQMALPQFDGPEILIYNQSLLDQLGLKYPEPDWTYQQAEALWRATARRVKGQWVPGCALYLSGSNWVSHAWGGTEAKASGTVALLDSPQNVQAWSWFADLTKSQVVVDRDLFWSSFSGGLSAFNWAGGWRVQSCAEMLNSFKWDFMLPPTFPAGKPSAYTNNDLNGINAYSNVPHDLAWDMLKLITLDPNYQRFLFRTTFVTPSVRGLWDDWAEIVQAVAPPLRGKHLLLYKQALDTSWPFFYFRYDPLQADAVKQSWLNKIIAGQVSPELGLHEATRQINALQAEGQLAAPAAAQALAQFHHEVQKVATSRGPIAVASPARTGAGTQATGAVPLVKRTASGFVLMAAGAGGVAQTADDCVFAASAFARSSGTFTCRLLSVTPLRGPALQAGAKVGLMARKSLGNAAAEVGVEFSLDRGLHAHVRAGDDTAIADQRAGGSAGLLAPGAVQAAKVAAGRNALLQPIWFRLVSNGVAWVPYTSLDGRSWSVAEGASGPLEVQFLGCWIGLFATSHTAGGHVMATFDSLSGFAPDTFVQIGSA